MNDPAKGTPEEQRAYREKIEQMMLDEMEEIRKRRAQLFREERTEGGLIIGAQGFGDGPRAIP